MQCSDIINPSYPIHQHPLWADVYSSKGSALWFERREDIVDWDNHLGVPRCLYSCARPATTDRLVRDPIPYTMSMAGHFCAVTSHMDGYRCPEDLLCAARRFYRLFPLGHPKVQLVRHILQGPLDPLVVQLAVVATAVLWKLTRGKSLHHLAPAAHVALVRDTLVPKQDILRREVPLLGNVKPVPDALRADNMELFQAGHRIQLIALKVEEALAILALEAETLDQRPLEPEPRESQGPDGNHVGRKVDPSVPWVPDKGTLVELPLDSNAPRLTADMENSGRPREATNLLSSATLFGILDVEPKLHDARFRINKLPDAGAKLS